MEHVNKARNENKASEIGSENRIWKKQVKEQEPSQSERICGERSGCCGRKRPVSVGDIDIPATVRAAPTGLGSHDDVMSSLTEEWNDVLYPGYDFGGRKTCVPQCSKAVDGLREAGAVQPSPSGFVKRQASRNTRRV
jgi:hypothetical protein